METNEANPAKNERKNFLLRYGVALTAVTAGLLLRSALNPLLGDYSIFSTLFPAIAFSALYGGLGAGLLATVVAAFAVNFFIVQPHYAFTLTEARDIAQLILFLTMGSFTSWIVSERKRFQSRLEQVESEAEQRQREDEEALRRVRQHSRLTEKSVGVGAWEWNLNTNEVRWSEGVYDLLGLDPESEKPAVENWMSYVYEDDRESALAEIRKSVDAGAKDFFVEFRFTRPKDKQIRWVASQGQIFRDGDQVRLLGVNYDITGRKESEIEIRSLNQELNRRLKELQTIFDIAPVGIAVAQDGSLDVIRANPALAEMLGVAPGENISVNPANSDRVPYRHFRKGHELPPDELPMQRAVREKRTILGAETDILRADGKLITIYAYAAPVFDAEGAVVSCIAAHIDVTERKKAEIERERQFDIEQALRLQAEEANRLKDEFLATISHELRTPLNSIIGWVTMLRNNRLAGEAKNRALEAIERGARSQSQLIEDLLDVSRIISGKLQLDTAPVELISVIDAAVETVRPAAEAKNIELKTFLQTQAGLVSGDFDRLQQIVWNLLSNAIKFTPADGEVKIFLRNSDRNAELVVSDTGRGISQDFLPFVFDRFRQADGSITRNFTGLGLGLAIVRHLVELHGGTVMVESPGEGRGSTFTVYLPLMNLPAAPDRSGNESGKVSGAAEADLYPPLDGVRILIVDDEANTREILGLIFKECRAEVEVAADADEALEKVKKWQPQVIISDIGMPGEDGYTFMLKVREWEEETGGGISGKISAIALTAYARDEDKRLALVSGFQAHVAKPVEPSKLTGMVAEMVKNGGAV